MIAATTPGNGFPRAPFALWLAGAAMWAGFVLTAQAEPSDVQGAPVFEKEVLPIFQTHCVRCHGPKMKLLELDLSTPEGVLQGSESGPVVTPGSVDDSKLYEKISNGLMPADKKTVPSAAEIDLIRRWIEAGASSTETSLGTAAAAGEQLSEHDVIPLMLLHCTPCHGTRTQEAELDLRTRASMVQGGKSGPAIVPGKPDDSLILKRIRAEEMPPPKKAKEANVTPMTPAEIERLANWIEQGAPEGNVQPDVAGSEPDPLVSDQDRQFWAFQPPRPTRVPTVRHAERVRNPVDAFILHKLEQKGLTLSAEAKRLTLLRRAYLDLTGLPPEPEEVQAFLADPDPKAYEKLIEQLLASDRYGERWGSYWLDVAGYTDHPHAYRYRDYVIRSFNEDKPYDRFVQEQIAGDELADYERAPVITRELMDNLVATGFLRMISDRTRSRASNYVPNRMEVITDVIDVFSSSMLGLTIKCARCHSHKFDPIPQRDYYRLVAVFQGAYDVYDWLPPSGKDEETSPVRYLPYVTPYANPLRLVEERREREAENEGPRKEIEALKDELVQKADKVRERLFEEHLTSLPAVLQEDLRQMTETPPEERSEIQKYLAERFEDFLKIRTNEVRSKDGDYRLTAHRIGNQMNILEAGILPEPRIRGLWDRGEPSPTYIMKRGDPLTPGRLVGPGVLSVLTDGQTPFRVVPPWLGAKKTGRRLALARWLTQSDHPLTSRVMVNRIWYRHFGQGIVKTLGDFGRLGDRPTHPQLLDWLAQEFVRGGFSVKDMHRLIMTSSTYRQVSTVTWAHEKLDPDNVLLSRMPMRRMEAELFYDSLLLVSGRLDETRFGPPDPVEVRSDGLVRPVATEKGWRRSIYVIKKVEFDISKKIGFDIPTLLDSFDYPRMSPNCLERNESTVATQALHLMNDAMVRELADSFAERVVRGVGTDPERQIERVYFVALSRPPTAEEKNIARRTLKGLAAQWANVSPAPEDVPLQALRTFCHAILNSAEFLYID